MNLNALAVLLVVVLAVAALVGVIYLLGTLALAGRRRAFRRGTYPLRLLPWYLGGPPEAEVDRPHDVVKPHVGRTRRRRR